ncbi:MAG TPA: hypothetical protein PLR97_06220 [Bacilli bacterium]|nr:hypothetical protein [Bacilli bacterium]
MPAYPKRLRYTHKIYIRRHINEIYTGTVVPTIRVVGYPDVPFKVMVEASGICRIKIIGIYNDETITERISFGEKGVQYSQNFFDTITSITSSYYVTGTQITISSVDSVGMPISWTQEFGPYWCEFGQHSGMQAQIDASALGLGSKTIHYVRVERPANLSKDMEFTINNGTQIYVPVSDFENISIPPDYVASEWAFRATAKTPGEPV